MTTSWLAILACAIGLSGCTEVYSTRPLGQPIWYEMQGTWQVDDDVYEVQLLPDGSLPMAWIEWNADKSQFNLGKGELVVSIDEGATYLNVRKFSDDPAARELYLFYRMLDVGGEPDVALIVAPDEDHFRGAVEKGVLSGEIAPYKIYVDDSRLTDFVDPLRFGEQFATVSSGSTALARRIVRFEGPDIEGTVLHQGQQAHMECLPDAARHSLGAAVRSRLEYLRSEPGKQLEQPIEMLDPATEQWAKFLNIDPEQWSRLMATLLHSDSEERYEFDKNGIAVAAKLSAADFSSYLTCLDSRGFELVNYPLYDFSDYGVFASLVAKDGFGLFQFFFMVE